MCQHKIYSVLVLVGLCVWAVNDAGIVHAQSSSQFRITTTIINNDVSSPTVPADLIAIAISSSRIDLSWTASTDNTAVTGYKVYRDLVFLATTTSTSYSDINLSPETIYAYTVAAFDGAFNESAQSAPSSATTEAVVVNPPSTRSGGASFQRLLINGINPYSSLNEAIISWTTTVPAQYTFQWGRTPDHELGIASGQEYSRNQTVHVDGLQPGKPYYFLINAFDSRGMTKSESGIFFTTTGPDTQSPINISAFKGLYSSAQHAIDLTWHNPIDTDFAGVRILRSEKFYPADIHDGVVIYTGSDRMTHDTDIKPDTVYFYTAFAYDTQHNYSSGSTARVRTKSVSETPPDQPPVIIPQSCFTTDPTQLDDVYAIQSNIKIPLARNMGIVSLTEPVMIFIDKSAVCQDLKTVNVTIDRESGEEVRSVLLTLNRDHNFYEGSFVPPDSPGRYKIRFTFYDFNDQQLLTIEGSFVVDGSGGETVVETSIDRQILLIIALFSAILLLLVVYFLRKFFKKHIK